MACASRSQSLVEPSMSVNRNVTVPVGGLATTTLMSSLLPLKGHYSSAAFPGSFVRQSAWRRFRCPFGEPEKASWAASSRPSADGLHYGCGKARLGCSASPHVLPSKQHFLESRRADSNRLPLLQLRVCGQWLLSVAWVCKSRMDSGFSVPCLAHYCRALRSG